MSEEENPPRETWAVFRVEGNNRIFEDEFPDVFSAADYIISKYKDGYVRTIEKVILPPRTIPTLP